MFNNKKIGIGITTFNSESYFKDLYTSLLPTISNPKSIIDELVIVNGGEEYKQKYMGNWIQHDKNHFPSVCRNDAIVFLLNRDIDYIFLIEDDMIIKDNDIFKKYIEAHEVTNLSYFCYVSTSYGSKNQDGSRNPLLSIKYPNSDVSISFYPNMCNEFTFHTKEEFTKCGLYDTKMRDAFDVDLVYRRSINPDSKTSYMWWFADITNSDNYIKNNPNAHSRLQANGEREKQIAKQWEYFHNKHGVYVTECSRKTEEELKSKLKNIYKKE